MLFRTAVFLCAFMPLGVLAQVTTDLSTDPESHSHGATIIQGEINGLALEGRDGRAALEARITALESQLVEADARTRDFAILVLCGYDPSVFDPSKVTC